MTKSIIVSGSTGQQGGAVVDALLSGEFGEFDVYGLTRDAGSEAAERLERRGVTIVEGDMTDLDSLVDAFAGMDYVFGVTTFFEVGGDAERQQGHNLVAAAEQTDIDYLVFSSVGSADADTGLEHFESKADTERLLADSDLQWTVLRPVFFMQNLGMSLEAIENGSLPLALAEDVPLAMIDAGDIGRAAAAAFADPESFVGETITLAGDELTLAETAAVLSEYTGRDVEPVYLPVEELRAAAGDEMADMFDWFNRVGYDIDVQATERHLGLELTGFEQWVADSGMFTPVAPAN
jgi:uncharacterized protein YbjT (DUF2867 family)